MYCIYSNSECDGNEISFWISMVGTIITTIALVFTIYQQMKLKDTSQRIAANTVDLKESIQDNFENWNITKSIDIIDKIELYLKSGDLSSSVIMMKQLQDCLAHCKKVFIVDFTKELEDCIKCLEGEKSATELSKMIKECKDKCCIDLLSEMKKQNKKLSKQYVNINRAVAENREGIDTGDCMEILSALRTVLTEIKPNPVTVNVK